MSNIHIPLESVRVASPCPASWDKMEGDDRARFCLTCHKNVYNLSEMSRQEAEALILEKEGNLCVRFYQRADGTVMTTNCPVGLRVVQRPFKWLAAGAAFLAASGIALATGHNPLQGGGPMRITPSAFSWRSISPIRMVMDMISPPPPPQVLTGMVSIAPRSNGTAPGGSSTSPPTTRPKAEDTHSGH
jgi:hypothetical protein